VDFNKTAENHKKIVPTVKEKLELCENFRTENW
jgi:hypothetical protein